MSEEVTSPCAECGASVYKQHIVSGIARVEEGRLFCSHCLAEREKAEKAAFAPIEIDDCEDEASLDSAESMSGSKIHSATQSMLGQSSAWDESRFNRPLDPKIAGGTRFRVFHSRLSEGAIDFMTGQINDWLEANKEIVVKFSNTVVGPFEGKHTEPNLVITVFY
jgi:hypothetical protein